MARHPKERPTPTNGLDRRSFLRGGVTAAAGLPLASAILAACKEPGTGSGGGETPVIELSRPDNPVTLPMRDSNPAIASGLQPESGATLKLYNWDQYIWRKVVDEFGEKFNCKVEISTFNNMDEALSKIRAGEVDFDVFFPTIDTLGKMAGAELIQPLNHDYLPNYKANIWPQYTDPGHPFYDMDAQYTVPYMVYRTGIAWRNDLVDEADWPSSLDNPWSAPWNAKYKGKIGVYDDYREGLSISMLRDGGRDLNTEDPAVIQKAGETLSELVEMTNAAFTINGAYEELPKGIFVMHQAWSGDIIASPWYGKGSFKETAPLMSYWWPEDGVGPIGSDCLAILKNSQNPVLAHEFINYMLDFDNAMKNMSWVGYQPPQIEAPPEIFADPDFKWSWVVPENLLNCVVQKEDFDTGLMQLELNPAVDAEWHAAWDQVTS